MMTNETITGLNVVSTNAGDDGEAMAQSEKASSAKPVFAPNADLAEPSDAGWFVAVVRVNCEERIAYAIQRDLNYNHVWFDHWIPKVKVYYIDKRTSKRRTKQKLFLSTFIFCRVSAKHVNDIRFRSDVYKMLTMPGQRQVYQIPDAEMNNYRSIVENDEEPVTEALAPLKKGVRVRVVAGSLKGIEAFVQSYNGKKAVIGNEIKFISGATITIRCDYLEVIDE